MLNMTIRKRHAPQLNIEERSKNQFKELISLFGWQTYDINPDVGLDLRIEIINEGVSTGQSFFVQLKGTQDSKKHLLSREKQYQYTFDSDDLKYLYQQSNPSYIILWDVNLRKGWYVSITDVIKHLNQTKPNWAKQKNVSIHIPVNQQLTPDNLTLIKNEIVEKALPSYLEREPLNLKVSLIFHNNDYGQNQYREFLNYLETGKPFELDKTMIQNIEVSDWFIRLMGEKSLDGLQIKLGGSIPISLPPIRIEFSTVGKGAISIDYVELRDIQHGTKQAILSNEHQKIPYKFKFTFIWPQKEGSFNITIDLTGADAVEAAKAHDLMCLLAEGGELRIYNLMTNDVQTLAYQPNPSLRPKTHVKEFVNCLAKIQRITGVFIHIPQNASFTNFDLENAKNILTLIENGYYQTHTDKAVFFLPKDDVIILATSYVSGEYYELESIVDNVPRKILSTNIPLGKIKQVIKGRCDIPTKELNEWIASAAETEKLKVEFYDVDVTEESVKYAEPYDD